MVKEFDSLYKKDSKGKVLEWKAKIENNSGQIDIMMSYGELFGQKALSWQRDIQGKNIGKSNETNSWEQAIKDIEGKILRKTRDGYKSLEVLTNSDLDMVFGDKPNTSVSDFEKPHLVGKNLETYLLKVLPEDNTNLEGNLVPMKAQQYYRTKKNWKDPYGKIWKDRKYYYLQNPKVAKEKGAIITKFPCIIQPKINGVRCFAQLVGNKVKLYSKRGLEYNIPQVEDFFNMNIDLFEHTLIPSKSSLNLLGEDKQEEKKTIELVFDGELYIHNEKLENITSAVKKNNLNTQRVKFIIFDLAIKDLGTIDRRKLLKSKLKNALIGHINPSIEVIKAYIVNNDAIVQIMTDDFIKEGYEGSILRAQNSEYMFGKRPQSMTKLKRLIDDEFVIVDILPQEKNPDLGLYLCMTKDGKEVKVTPTGTEEFKAKLLINSHEYIGKELTCWFYEYTEQGLPFHIVDTLIRDYE